MNPPSMAGWNLALRFGLEVAAVAGLAVGAWKLTSGNIRWIVAIAVPSIAVAIWGVFNVLDDPSRSGAAPVEVSGVSRLAIELLILGGGVAALAIVGHSEIAVALGALIAVHYLTSWTRIEWLVQA